MFRVLLSGHPAFLLQAFHAVANFKSSDDLTVTPPLPKEDPLRALTERGHESVYNKGPASESQDQMAPAPVERPPPRGLKRASVDVELLAPRGPMGKETMLTFSHTLPRGGAPGAGSGPVLPVQPVQRRLKALPVPMDPARSQQLVTEWKQKSMEMRGLSSEGPGEGGAQARRAAPCRDPSPPPGGAKAVATPRPPQIPEAGPPPVSPKSALTRAKWLAIREKTSREGPGPGAAGQPRLMQVIAVSKQLLPSSSSETASTCSGSSSSASPLCSGIVTVDAHAPHHPVVPAQPPLQAPPLAGNGAPWGWNGASNGADPRDAYDLNSLTRGDSAARGSSFRPHRSASPGPDAPPPISAGRPP